VGRAEPRRPQAVIDTSFWAAAFQAQLIGYLLRVYEATVPVAVEREVLAPNRRDPRLLYPQQALFQQLRGLMHSAPPDVPQVVGSFGAGERDAISTALHLGTTLLINDRDPARFAQALQVPILYVPDFVVLIRAQGLVTHARARSMIDMAGRMTAPQVVATALTLLDQLQDPES
jgi:predicted nucleic acid-binding protein